MTWQSYVVWSIQRREAHPQRQYGRRYDRPKSKSEVRAIDAANEKNTVNRVTAAESHDTKETCGRIAESIGSEQTPMRVNAPPRTSESPLTQRCESRDHVKWPKEQNGHVRNGVGAVESEYPRFNERKVPSKSAVWLRKRFLQRASIRPRPTKFSKLLMRPRDKYHQDLRRVIRVATWLRPVAVRPWTKERLRIDLA
jgi:hypothetical protein